jgi:hypothetical protein
MQLHRTRGMLEHFFRPLRLLAFVPDAVLRIVGTWTKRFVGWRCHCPLVNVDDAARRVEQPVLLIHGRHDVDVPLEAVLSLRSLMSRRTRLWVVPHARHNRAIATAPEEYRRRLARFFCRGLRTVIHIDGAHSVAAHANGSRANGLAQTANGAQRQSVRTETAAFTEPAEHAISR